MLFETIGHNDDFTIPEKTFAAAADMSRYSRQMKSVMCVSRLMRLRSLPAR